MKASKLSRWKIDQIHPSLYKKAKRLGNVATRRDGRRAIQEQM